MKKLTKYEQETILLTNQDTDEYSVFACNKPFRRRLIMQIISVIILNILGLALQFEQFLYSIF